MQAGPECHLAPNASSLALGPFSNERELYLDVLDKLSWGVLYMYFNERIPLTYPSLPAKQYPITFEEIRPGMVRGSQRIITMNSGVYGWPNDQSLHRVFKFDSRGAIRVSIQESNESRTAANESNETRVAVRCDHPQQRDPLVEDFGRASQDLASSDENVKRSAAAAFEKVVGARQQTNRVRG